MKKSNIYFGNPNYLVPMIPIEVDFTDCDLGFLDIWIGIDECVHIEFKATLAQR